MNSLQQKWAEPLLISGVEVQRGSRVRLRARGPKDALDLALTGRTATVESIERDREGRFHLAVILGDERQENRMFFDAAEVEPVRTI